jgi:transposase InsO family protein
MGHLNFTDMLTIASKEIVKDLPKMKGTRKGVCGPCQLGK